MTSQTNSSDGSNKESGNLSQASFFKKVNKSFDILGSVYKELSLNYLIDVDPEILMEKAIEGMLANLDPYTVYYSSKDETLSDRLNGEEYIGFGIRVSIIDSNVYVSSVRKGYGAEKAGFKVGDRIKSIDETELYSISLDSLSNYTRGEAGTSSQVVLVRNGEEVKTRVDRMNIMDPAVTYQGMLDNGVGYVSFKKFSEGSAGELRSAIKELDNQGDLQGLVIDLRGNGGGLLGQAVEIVEMFVENNSEIVATKGRNDNRLQDYKATNNPDYPNLPLAIIVDGNSASASEVVSGAIQDLDRGIIVGRKSFGKGLVQTYATLPHGSKLKLTTANYYTPSGRSIQKLDIEKLVLDKERQVNDTVKYSTINGRSLPDHDGIMPDTLTNTFGLPDEYLAIINPNYVFEFVTRNIPNTNKFGLNSDVDDALVESLIDSIDFKLVRSALPELRYLNYIDDFNDSEMGQSFLEVISEAKGKILVEARRHLKKRKAKIKLFLKLELLRRNLTLDEYNKFILTKDMSIAAASSIITNEQYRIILDNSQNNTLIESPTSYIDEDGKLKLENDR